MVLSRLSALLSSGLICFAMGKASNAITRYTSISKRRCSNRPACPDFKVLFKTRKRLKPSECILKSVKAFAAPPEASAPITGLPVNNSEINSVVETLGFFSSIIEAWAATMILPGNCSSQSGGTYSSASLEKGTSEMF